MTVEYSPYKLAFFDEAGGPEPVPPDLIAPPDGNPLPNPPPPPPPPPTPSTTPNSVEGSWEYQTGGFKDTHIFLPNGKMGNPPPAPEGAWTIEGGQLVIRWKSPGGTWINEYAYVEGAGQLSGFTIDPSGQRTPCTLVRRGD